MLHPDRASGSRRTAGNRCPTDHGNISYRQRLAIVIAIISALVARAATVYSCAPLSSLLMRHRNIPPNWNPLLVWGGLRGAIAIALVLTLPVQLPYWYTVQSMVFGVVLFNLLIQGTTCRPLVRRLSKGD